jgi:hypothetical protein
LPRQKKNNEEKLLWFLGAVFKNLVWKVNQCFKDIKITNEIHENALPCWVRHKGYGQLNLKNLGKTGIKLLY